MQWYRMMDAAVLAEGELVGVDVAGTPVVICNVDGEIRAWEDRCPHRFVPLSKGTLDGETLTCRNHQWEFNARTGRASHSTSSSSCPSLSRWRTGSSSWGAGAETFGGEGGRLLSSAQRVAW